MLFWEYFEQWIDNYKKGNVRFVTLEAYRGTLERLKQYAPKLKLQDLDRQSYQQLINKYADGRHHVTVSKFHTHLNSSLKDAVYDEILKKNPAERCKVGGLRPSKKKKKWLSMFEAQCLIRELELGEYMNNDYIIFFSLKTGVRFSEALGITVKDIDMEKQKVSINKTLNYKYRNVEERYVPTKNQSSNRVIDVDWGTLNKIWQIVKDYPPDEPIFVYNNINVVKNRKTVEGTDIVHNSTVNDRLEVLCSRAGITKISVHGLRHTHASLLLANGVSIPSVSKRLGHSNMATTQKVYLHIIDELANKDMGLTLASMMTLGG